MKTLIVGSDEVRTLLPMEDCVLVMRNAMITLAKGDVVLPLRQVVRLPNKKGMLGMMPAYFGGTSPVVGIKDW